VVQLNPGTETGAGTVTGTAVLGGDTFSDSINFATSVAPASPDTISLGVDFDEADICEDNNNDNADDGIGYQALAIYVEDKGNSGRALTAACQVSGSDSFNTLTAGPTRELQTGVTATIKVHVYNETDSALYTDPISVTFSSLCAEIGKATLGSVAETTATVTSVGGVATTTYLADGCVGEDTITAIATVGVDNLAAQVTFDIETPAVSSIEFISADPQVLALKGTGGANRVETSVVTFRVVGTDGNPSANRDVYLELLNEPGGVTLDTNLATSNSDGLVEVTVSSGTVPGTLKVRARFDVDGNEPDTSEDIVVSSDELSISSGLADQDGINIFAEVLNPEAWNYPNETVEITAALNDRTGEVVAIGTAVYFRTEMGRIGDAEGDAVCFTDATGSCSVTWYSNGPEQTLYQHYDDTALGGLGVPGGTSPGFDRKGRNVIYAVTQGEETFTDFDGDNVYDPGSGDGFTSLPEVFLDYNENGTRETGDGVSTYLEPYVEYNGDATYDAADLFYNGVTCSAAAITAGHCADLVNVSDSLTMAVSTSGARLYLSDDSADLAYVNYTNGVDGIPDWTAAGPQSSGTYALGDFAATVSGIATDLNGNALPAGTTISATVDSADQGWEVLGTSSYVVGSSSLETGFSFTVQIGDSGVSSALVTVTAETPKGNSTSQTFTLSLGGGGCHSIHLTEATRSVDEGVATVTVDIGVDVPDFGCTGDINFDYFVTGVSAGDHVFDDISDPAPTSSTAVSGTYTLLEAQNYTATATFTITDDTDVEVDETMSIFIGNPTNGASIGTNGSYVLTITDND
jgi:hypothetical protein